MNKLFICFVCIATISCSNHKIGDKIYLEIWDRGTKLHIDKHCKNISKDHMVDFIDIKEWANSHDEKDFISLCPECVSDEDADLLKNLLKNKPDTIADNLDSEILKSLDGVRINN